MNCIFDKEDTSNNNTDYVRWIVCSYFVGLVYFFQEGGGVIAVQTDYNVLLFFTDVKMQQIETYSLHHRKEGGGSFRFLVHRERFS